LARAALKHGVTLPNTTGRLRSWAFSIQAGRPKSVRIKLYRGYAYIFRHKRLITVYRVPEGMED
jgi:hypothetical protein